ncbi:Alpha-actinin-like protein 1 [Neolecta irregularis DAH-3]|uniref:Alpha-actinin-like protein 1 n=1 Tax=Neolecta irregularis (strain DAH-3) TaxID=1198029 RepID=A0A1U7LWF2_NEOID|nr:Alpha-actinin-like protein 1 [Neolecta irregularis DAH-3]|eukprot:OLL26997.1 Alpha-actinin-like protein 1 [Neolecta irregularis DAH-3]
MEQIRPRSTLESARLVGGDLEWQDTQHKTFSKCLTEKYRVNTKLSSRKITPAENLKYDLSDGIRLIQLLVCINHLFFSKTTELIVHVGSNRRGISWAAENVNSALDYIKNQGFPLTNIGAEDIIDGNLKIILGLIWTLILRFTIADINEEGVSAKAGLLLWCQRKTAGYPGVDVIDFTTRCAIINRYRPDLIDYNSLDHSKRKENTAMAMQLAAEHLDIPQLLDVEDLCDVQKPDERSVMTYIAEYFHAFSAMDQHQTAGRRVERFAQMLLSAWEMKTDYEQRLLDCLMDVQNTWHASLFDGTYADAKRQSYEFAEYKKTEKRSWSAEKTDVESLFGNIQVKIKTYGLKPYWPPPGLELGDLETAWKELLAAEANRSKDINGKIREQINLSFADKANEFSLRLGTVTLEITTLEGELEDQLLHMQRVKAGLDPLNNDLLLLEKLEKECISANIEENDYTIYSFDDLAYEFDLAMDSVAKKLAFIENQIVARDMTNLTPAQLEEFESVFRHFDKDHSNVLQSHEFNAALASFGVIHEIDEQERLFNRVSTGTGVVRFEQFIRFMVELTEDQNTPEQVCQSFREAADHKPYITELDLHQAFVPIQLVDYLTQTMPYVETEYGERAYDYTGYILSSCASANGHKFHQS